MSKFLVLYCFAFSITTKTLANSLSINKRIQGLVNDQQLPTVYKCGLESHAETWEAPEWEREPLLPKKLKRLQESTHGSLFKFKLEPSLKQMECSGELVYLKIPKESIDPDTRNYFEARFYFTYFGYLRLESEMTSRPQHVLVPPDRFCVQNNTSPDEIEVQVCLPKCSEDTCISKICPMGMVSYLDVARNQLHCMESYSEEWEPALMSPRQTDASRIITGRQLELKAPSVYYLFQGECEEWYRPIRHIAHPSAPEALQARIVLDSKGRFLWRTTDNDYWKPPEGFFPAGDGVILDICQKYTNSQQHQVLVSCLRSNETAMEDLEAGALDTSSCSENSAQETTTVTEIIPISTETTTLLITPESTEAVERETSTEEMIHAVSVTSTHATGGMSNGSENSTSLSENQEFDLGMLKKLPETIMLSAAAFFLLLIVIVYFLIWGKVNVTGWVIAFLCLTRFSYLVFDLLYQRADEIASGSCLYIGILRQFFQLSSSMWFVIYSGDVWRVMRSKVPPYVQSKGRKLFLSYFLVGIGIPGVLTAISAAVESQATYNDLIGPGYCEKPHKGLILLSEIFHVMIPASLCFLISVVFASFIFRAMMSNDKESMDEIRLCLAKDFTKVFVLVKLEWIVYVVLLVLEPTKTVLLLWTPFAGLVLIRSFFMFWIFVCNKQVRGQVREVCN